MKPCGQKDRGGRAILSRRCHLHRAVAIQGAHVSACSAVSGNPQSVGAASPGLLWVVSPTLPHGRRRCCLKTIRADVVGEVAFAMEFQGSGVFLSCDSPSSRCQAPSAGNCNPPAGGGEVLEDPRPGVTAQSGDPRDSQKPGHIALCSSQHRALGGKLPFPFLVLNPRGPKK